MGRACGKGVSWGVRLGRAHWPSTRSRMERTTPSNIGQNSRGSSSHASHHAVARLLAKTIFGCPGGIWVTCPRLPCVEISQVYETGVPRSEPPDHTQANETTKCYCLLLHKSHLFGVAPHNSITRLCTSATPPLASSTFQPRVPPRVRQPAGRRTAHPPSVPTPSLPPPWSSVLAAPTRPASGLACCPA